ncbi:hypothetical protein RND81_08G142400 [Saponaria officinalis]|uniref:BHLH domain-containing protein n=1 Tax=Saponaria officinalis TaxID=3572 RepID=A0AAW1J8W9_SAPOF
MVLEAMLNYNDIFNYMVCDTLNAAHYECNVGGLENVSVLEKAHVFDVGSSSSLPVLQQGQVSSKVRVNQRVNVGVQGRKKRRRRPKVCKNKEEAETQRRTHIAVERNRRKQMNEHLAVLRSLMPESYSLRGDQASVVGGAIDYVKELEHLVHSLEAQKLLILQQEEVMRLGTHDTHTTPLNPDVFSNPQRSVTEHSNKFTLKSRTEAADVEVTLIETHANLRILSRKNPRQLSKLVAGFHSFCLTILHLNVITLDPLVLYSISAKVEEGCQLTSVDSISQAVHQMLRIIEEDVSSYLVNLLAA